LNFTWWNYCRSV